MAIGQAQAQTLADAGLPAAAIIPPGRDLQHFTPDDRAQARSELGLAPDDGIVHYVGRLAPDKNVETLLKAFAGLQRNIRSSQLLVLGDGPTKASLQLVSRQLRIDEAVTFLPSVAHHLLPAYYRAADVTVVPSDYLWFGLHPLFAAVDHPPSRPRITA